MQRYLPTAAIIRYRELWLRLVDLFPTVMSDIEQGLEERIIMYETYRYKAVVRGEGYMVWVLRSSPLFWHKAILPILAEYKADRITWSTHRYNPRAFLVKLPLNRGGVQDFREWAKSGSTDTTVFIHENSYGEEWLYSDDDDWDDDWDYDCEYDFFKEDQYEEIEEMFDKKVRMRRKR